MLAKAAAIVGVKLLMFEQLASLCQGWTMNPLGASRTMVCSSGGKAAIFAVSGSILGTGGDGAGSNRMPGISQERPASRRDGRQADDGIQLPSPRCHNSELLKSSPLPTLSNYRPSLIVLVCHALLLHDKLAIYWLHVMVGQMQSRAIVEYGSCLGKLMYPQIPTKNN